MARNKDKATNSSGANIGFEQKLWLAADKQQFAESEKLEGEIRKNLTGLGYEVNRSIREEMKGA